MSRHLNIAWMLLIALVLTACGAPSRPVQAFIKQHTQCQSLGYGNPQWSPDGALIYYFVHDTNSTEVRVMNSLGKNDQLLGQASDALLPQLSPNHTMLLFEQPAPQTSDATDLDILDLKTGKTRQVASKGSGASWSPDSQWIVYLMDSTANGPLAKVSAASGQIVALTDTAEDTPDHRLLPHWSPDGKTIAYTKHGEGDRLTVMLISADGSDARALEIRHR